MSFSFSSEKEIRSTLGTALRSISVKISEKRPREACQVEVLLGMYDLAGKLTCQTSRIEAYEFFRGKMNRIARNLELGGALDDFGSGETQA